MAYFIVIEEEIQKFIRWQIRKEVKNRKEMNGENGDIF
jgi:hypothetical protein